MKDLRERCEKFFKDIDYKAYPEDYHTLEAFAREVAAQARQEALEEAAQLLDTGATISWRPL